MATIASLVVSLVAETAGFVRGLDGAEKKTNVFSRSIEHTAAKLLALHGVIRLFEGAAKQLEDLSRVDFHNLDALEGSAVIADHLVKAIPYVNQIYESLNDIIDVTSSWIAGTETEKEQLEEVARAAEAAAKNIAAINAAGDFGRKSSSAFLAGRAPTDAAKANIETAAKLKAVDEQAVALKAALAQTSISFEQLQLEFARIDSAAQMQKLAIQDAATGLFDYQRSLQQIIDTAGMTADEIKLKELADRGAIAAAIEDTRAMQAQAAAAKLLSDAMSSARSLEQSWSDAIETFGMSSREAAIHLLEIEEAASHNPALQALIDHLKELDANLGALEAHQKAMEEGKQVFDATRTPLEKYNAELERLQKLLDDGAISQDTFERATKSAKDQLGRTTGDDKQQIRSIERRFVAGFDPNLKLNHGADPLQDLLKEDRRLRLLGEKQVDYQAKMAEGITRLVNDRPVPLDF